MNNTLTASRPLLHRALLALARHPRRIVQFPLGLSRWDDTDELILAAPHSPASHTFLLARSEDMEPLRDLPLTCAGMLLIGGRGRAVGYRVRATGVLEPLTRLRLVGAGMHQFDLVAAQRVNERLRRVSVERWSRTIGALGMDTWWRLVQLHYGIIGTGRTGSIIAQMLVRLGATRVWLCDPDRMEFHNLGEMVGVTEADLGQFKVDALAAVLRNDNADVVPVVTKASITDLRALGAARRCDFLYCCCDHDSGRWAASILAALFCKPLIDVATGVERGTARTMGADVRLVLPGRCLACLGGFRQPVAAGRVLLDAELESRLRVARDWSRERAGSLASLNHLAAAAGLRMLEDLVAERLTESVWLRLEFDPRGRLSTRYLERANHAVPGHCALCVTLAGLGDAGLDRVPGLLRSGPPV